MIRICEKCHHVTGQRHCVYCGHGEPAPRPRHSFGLGVHPRNHESRQQERRQDFAYAMKAVNEKNLKPVFAQNSKRIRKQVGWSGMKRRDRRKLAKAYFRGEWRKGRAA